MLIFAQHNLKTILKKIKTMSTTSAHEQTSNPCDIFNSYPSGGTTADKVAWLRRTFSTSVDPQYYDCILNAHSYKIADFQKGISDYIATNGNLIATTFSIDELKKNYDKLAINYDNFISFEVNNTTNQLEVSVTKDFLTDPTKKNAPVSYSIPLLESVFATMKTTELVFAKVLIGSFENVVFFEKGQNVVFYDYSEEPK